MNPHRLALAVELLFLHELTLKPDLRLGTPSETRAPLLYHEDMQNRRTRPRMNCAAQGPIATCPRVWCSTGAACWSI